MARWVPVIVHRPVTRSSCPDATSSTNRRSGNALRTARAAQRVTRPAGRLAGERIVIDQDLMEHFARCCLVAVAPSSDNQRLSLPWAHDGNSARNGCVKSGAVSCPKRRASRGSRG
jgi:hypothetical protein